jgi:N-acetylmuramoyl-L-alanine amidase
LILREPKWRGVKDIPIGDGLLRMARVGQYRHDIVRVVLDIDSMKDFKIFPFPTPTALLLM